MRRISITEKLILYFLFLSLIAIFVVGSYSYITSRSVLMKRVFDQLTSVRMAKKNNIEHFFYARINEIQLISRSQNILNMFENLEGDDTRHAEQHYSLFIKQYNDYLQKYFEECGYYSSLFIGNISGQLVHFNIDQADTSQFHYFGPVSEPEFDNVLEQQLRHSGKPLISDYRRITSTVFSPLMISAPVFDEQNKYRGFISLAIKEGAINDIMLETDPLGGLGNTGESYLVGPDSLMRSQSRFIEKSLLKIKVSTPGAESALAGNEGTVRLMDYRKIDVFNSHGPLKIPGLNWVILAEIDYSEAMVPLTNIRNEILVLTIFLSMIVFIAIFFIARKISRPIVRLKNAAEKIGEGNFDTQLAITSQDEIGTLTDTFNKMASQLKRMTGDLKDREERLKHFYDAAIDGQEIERERLSRELHDGLGQELIAMKLKLESAVGNADEGTQSILNNLRNMFDSTIDEIRRISNDLMPSGLQQFGIVNALRKLGSEISDSSGINVCVEAENFYINPGNKTILYLYRIVQEAISNAVKHAGAEEISIKLSNDQQQIYLTVTDNGKGFAFEKNQKFAGNGIYNMHERVYLLNGSILIDSQSGSGTSINIQIPFDQILNAK